jgi:hypothetical protein
MQYYAPSIPAVENVPLIPDSTPTLVCPSCGDTMRLSQTIPKHGVRPEQLIFNCPSCNDVSTKEVKRPLWRDILKMRREHASEPVKMNHAFNARRIRLSRTRAPTRPQIKSPSARPYFNRYTDDAIAW